jgi:starvation-inducible DNA-binding protein
MKKNTPSITALNHMIAAYSILSQNARYCHWNISGPQFLSYHGFFGELYSELSDEVDEFAERIRALSATPESQYSSYLRITKIGEYSGVMTTTEMLDRLWSDYHHLSLEMSKFILETAEDSVSQDILVGAKRLIDKRLWMISALLK